MRGKTSGIADFGATGDYDDDGIDRAWDDEWMDDGMPDGDVDDAMPWAMRKASQRHGVHRGEQDGHDGQAALGEMNPAEKLMAILGHAVGWGGGLGAPGKGNPDGIAQKGIPAGAAGRHDPSGRPDGHMPWAWEKAREIKARESRGDTSQDLLDMMHAADQSRAADVERRYRDFLAASGEGGDDGASVGVMRGTVRMSFIARLGYQGHWSVRFTVAAASGRPYVVKDVLEFLDAVDHGGRVVYGKGLAFVHSPEMFDERSRRMLALLRRMLAARDAAFTSRRSWYYEPSHGIKDLDVSQQQLVQLLDLVGNGTVAVEVGDGYEFRKHTVRVFDTDPMLGIHMRRIDRDGMHGYRIEHAASIHAFVQGDGDVAYALVGHGAGDLSLHRCSPAFMRARQALETLCQPDGEPYFLADAHRALFARTMLPQLVGGAVRATVPDELRGLRVDPCRGEFYLDRDPYGDAVCHAVARYGSRQVEVFGGDAKDDDALFSRDMPAEELLRTAVGRYFTVPAPLAAQGADAAGADASGRVEPALPYVPADDADAMLRLVTTGLQALGSVGTIYTTPRFDALLKTRPAKVEVGLSVKHDLIVFSAMSDEIPADQIGSVLDSYRRHRRYHRLRDGTFLDLKDADLGQFADLTGRLDIAAKDLDGGEVTLPGYEGFMLDAEENVDKDESFTRYLDDFRVVDPARYRVPPSLDHVLRPYQRDGFRWLNALVDKNFGGILADEMGLGKSLQLISMLLSRREEMAGVGPALIVCPASLVYNWAGEFAKFAPDMRCETVAGTKSQRTMLVAKAAPVAEADGDGGAGDGTAVADGNDQSTAARAADAPEVLVTSYDLLRRDIELYRGRRFYCMALDEAQVIKNQSTKIAKAVKSVDADHRIALTGTPIENRLSELWSIFDFLMPGMLASYRTFRARYERPVFDGDETATARLKALVTPFILRRLKKDVLKDLPDKMEDVVTVRLEGEQRRLYGAHEKQLRLFLEGNQDVRTHRIQILSELTKLREICCDPRLLYENAKDASAKLAAIEELVETSMDGGHKMLIFSQFTSFLKLIAARLDAKGIRYDEITGGTPKKERVDLVERFNKDDTPVFLISLKAGGTGLNLTGATVVVHADPWWNAAAQNQATDRAHRIGQTDTVNVYQIVAKDTIEERIVQMQREKSKLAASIVGATGEAGTGLGELTRDDLLRLLG